MSRSLTWGFTFNGPNGLNALARRGELPSQLKLRFSKGEAGFTVPSEVPPLRRLRYRDWEREVEKMLQTQGE